MKIGTILIGPNGVKYKVYANPTYYSVAVEVIGKKECELILIDEIKSYTICK